jgi:predicted nucleotidyltransferase
MKHATFDAYPAEGLDLARRTLITVWDSLVAYHDDLVLVGGLAVDLITHPPVEGVAGAVTMDVDLGVSLAAGLGMYGSIAETLAGHGFRWEEGRFIRVIDGLRMYVDLLTDDGRSLRGTAMVDEGLGVSILPGIERALASRRAIPVKGCSLVGGERTLLVQTASVGPLLVLKLNAFGGPTGRKAPKDAHDVMHLLTNYLDGPSAAVAAFHEEWQTNRGMAGAVEALKTCFLSPEADGSLACAAFRLNNRHLEPELEEESLQIRQQCVTFAEALLAGLPG